MTVEDQIDIVNYCIEVLDKTPKCRIAADKLRAVVTTYSLMVGK